MRRAVMLLIGLVILSSCDMNFTGKKTDAEKVIFTISHGEYKGGTITRDPLKNEYKRKEKVTLTAAADEGYVFSSWSGTLESEEKAITVTMDKNYELTPVFKSIPVYTITFGKYEGGSITIEPDKKQYYENEKVTLTAVPDADYYFTKWDGFDSDKNTIELTMNNDYSLLPVFNLVTKYTLTIEESAGGKTIVENEDVYFLPGEEAVFRAVSDPGYRFVRWSGDSDEETSKIKIQMNSNCTFKPVFEKIPDVKFYSIESVDIEGDGNVIIEPLKDEYAENEEVTIRASANTSTIVSSLQCSSAEYTLDDKNKIISVSMKSNITVHAEFIKRQWTFVVYMAADNDLESAAIQDFNELEAVDYFEKPVSILVLFDRHPGYDSTNGNWSGTRLYEVQTDANGADGVIRSKQIGCSALDLSAEYSTNLNTSRYEVMSSLLDFVHSAYTAENYGLIVWGHGTGWRGGTDTEVKAFAVDDTAGDFMTNASFGKAVDGKGLSFIGLDTCFGAILETAYELQGKTQRLVASEGSVPFSGWNYTALFNGFVNGPRTLDSLCSFAVSQYENQYSLANKCTISDINIPDIPDVKNALDALAKKAGSLVVSTSIRQQMLSIILNSVLGFSHSNYPCELYIDMYSFAQNMAASYPVLNNESLVLQNSLRKALVHSWSSFESSGWYLGVFFSELQSKGVACSLHSSSYVQGSGVPEQSKFVLESNGWVPHEGGGTSLIDKLFYTVF